MVEPGHGASAYPQWRAPLLGRDEQRTRQLTTESQANLSIPKHKRVTHKILCPHQHLCPTQLSPPGCARLQQPFPRGLLSRPSLGSPRPSPTTAVCTKSGPSQSSPAFPGLWPPSLAFAFPPLPREDPGGCGASWRRDCICLDINN